MQKSRRLRTPTSKLLTSGGRSCENYGQNPSIDLGVRSLEVPFQTSRLLSSEAIELIFLEKFKEGSSCLEKSRSSVTLNLLLICEQRKNCVSCAPSFYEMKKDLDESEDAIKTLIHARGKKQPDPKSALELLLLLLKVFRDEKKEEVESEEAIQELSSKSNKKQPELKKQRDL